MGSRGPAPTPTEILKRRGSREISKRKNEPKPDKGQPVTPDMLDGDAKQVWDQLTDELDKIGVLTVIDGNALVRYCRMWVRWQQCDAFIKKYGESYPLKDANGNVRCFQQFPEVGILNKLSVLLLRLEQEFGLTPAARTRIQVDVSAAKQTKDKERFFRTVG
ncbi:phage terminase small subunit P27 family [Petrachloros mirabilis]